MLMMLHKKLIRRVLEFFRCGSFKERCKKTQKTSKYEAVQLREFHKIQPKDELPVARMEHKLPKNYSKLESIMSLNLKEIKDIEELDNKIDTIRKKKKTILVSGVFSQQFFHMSFKMKNEGKHEPFETGNNFKTFFANPSISSIFEVKMPNGNFDGINNENSRDIFASSQISTFLERITFCHSTHDNNKITKTQRHLEEMQFFDCSPSEIVPIKCLTEGARASM